MMNEKVTDVELQPLTHWDITCLQFYTSLGKVAAPQSTLLVQLNLNSQTLTLV